MEPSTPDRHWSEMSEPKPPYEPPEVEPLEVDGETLGTSPGITQIPS